MTAIIFVTHNSQKFLPKAMDAVRKQTRPADQIIISDTGSDNLGYLDAYPEADIVIAGQGVGFCVGNNVGYQQLRPEIKYVFFLNPDCFIHQEYIEHAVDYMEEHPEIGAVSGPLLGYDIEQDRPTGKWDSTGIFCNWYGKWYDRAQGDEIDPDEHFLTEEVPAICGAAFFARKKALDKILVNGKEVMDSSFFMYKEDIDLSIRLREREWKLMYCPELEAYHCRGWKKNRRKMPRRYRLCSSRNELRIQKKLRKWLPIVYSGTKHFAVKFLNA